MLILALALILFSVDATSQTVTKVVEVEVGTGDVKPSVRTNNGQFVTVMIDSMRVLRMQLYPTVQRDTVRVPDSLGRVGLLGVTASGSIFTSTSRTTGAVRLAALAHDDTAWRDISHLLPAVDAQMGSLRLSSSNRVFALTGQSTVVIVGTYGTSTSLSQTTYRSVIANAWTYQALRTYDSVAIGGVTPGGQSYYSLRTASDSTAQLCTYYDPATGQQTHTVRCRFDYTTPTGIDHIMHSGKMIGNIDEAPSPFIQKDRWLVRCTGAPNIFFTVRYNGKQDVFELYDLHTRTGVVIDSTSGVITIDDVEQRVSFTQSSPFRIAVYDYGGGIGRQGVVWFRNVDTANVYENVSYGAVYLGYQRMKEIVGIIDGRTYVLSGRTEPLLLSEDQRRLVPFTVEARDSSGTVTSRDTAVPLVVRYPASYTTVTRVGQDVQEMSFSADEQSVSVESDSMTTILPLRGASTPVFDAPRVITMSGTTLHVSQSKMTTADTYVSCVLRQDDSTAPFYERWIDQIAVNMERSDTSTIRSVWIEPDVNVSRIRTVSNDRDQLIGLCVNGNVPDRGRLYVTQKSGKTWMPYGDTNGIDVPGSGRVDLSIPGHVVATSSSGRVIMKRLIDASTRIDAMTYYQPAIVIDDTTILNAYAFWKLRDGIWIAAQNLEYYYNNLGYYSADVVRLSSGYSAIVGNFRRGAVVILDNATMSVAATLGPGFATPTCAIYSKRYHGLFIGHQTGVVGFVPIPSKYETPTSMSIQQPPTVPTSVTSCVVYTLAGSKMLEIPCTSQLSDRDAESLHLPTGLYIAVYSQEHGPAFSRMLMLWR